MAACRNFAFKIATKPLQIERHGHYWQPTGTCHRSIQRHHRRPLRSNG